MARVKSEEPRTRAATLQEIHRAAMQRAERAKMQRRERVDWGI